jgi:hypothetical protein
MTWCIETCNFDVDVDLLFHENLTIGQKMYVPFLYMVYYAVWKLVRVELRTLHSYLGVNFLYPLFHVIA